MLIVNPIVNFNFNLDRTVLLDRGRFMIPETRLVRCSCRCGEPQPS